MERILGPYANQIHALMRIVVGFLFTCHGAQKLFGWFGGGPEQMNAMLWAAGILEFFGGILIVIGLFTSWTAFILSGQMAVAYFLAHQPRGLLPIQNQGELAALYAWVFLFLAARGSGAWAVDSSD